MSESVVKPYTDFVLPLSVVSRADISRLASEAERVDNALTSTSVHEQIGSDNNQGSVAMSAQFVEFLNQNDLSMDDSLVRTELIKQLRQFKDKVPVLNMTFAVDADPESLQEITKWVRESVHPQAVIAVGLQPALVAGVYLRTPNHVHDMSLRALFKGSHRKIIEALGASRGDV